jgi:tetratricopeptide (TPR) repeat protein
VEAVCLGSWAAFRRGGAAPPRSLSGADMPADAVDVAALALARRAAMLDADDGRLPQAEAELGRIVAVLGNAEPMIARRALAETLTERALVRMLANRHEEALADLDRSLLLAEHMPPLLKRSVAFSALARRCKLRAKPATPVHDLDAAARDVEAARGIDGLDWLLDELDCTIARERGDWPRVAELSPRVGERMQAEGFAVGHAFCALRTAQSLFELGRAQGAGAALAEALPLLEQHGPPDQLARALLLTAQLASRRGEHEAAWRSAERALALGESLVRHFRALADQHRFVADKIAQYRQAFAIALARGDDTGIARAWSVAERAKGFYLCQLVANADVPLFEGVGADTLARLRRLEDELDRVELRLAAADPGAQFEALARQAQRLQGERDAAFAEAMRGNPRWAALRTPPPPDIARLLPRIAGRFVLLSLFVMPDANGLAVHCFHSDGGPPRHRRLLFDWEDRRQLEACRHDLEQFGARDPFLPALPQAQCGRLLAPELVAALSPDKPLLVSAHGVFASLALQATTLAGGRRLIEHCPVQFVPTLALLGVARPARAGEMPAAAEPVLLIGCAQDGFRSPPLPDVPAEIEELAQVWSRAGIGARAELLPPQATPAKRRCDPPHWRGRRVVHVACHGVFDPAQPFDAALLLGADKLRAAEFFTVRLDTEAVILSACDVGRRADALEGVAAAFDEWLGLYLPLYYAGAGVLVASRWSANSGEARAFMRALHDELAGGATPADAARAASLAMIDLPEVFWANWIVSGVPALGD